MLPEAILVSLFSIIFKGIFTLGFSLVGRQHPESWFALLLAATSGCAIHCLAFWPNSQALGHTKATRFL